MVTMIQFIKLRIASFKLAQYKMIDAIQNRLWCLNVTYRSLHSEAFCTHLLFKELRVQTFLTRSKFNVKMHTLLYQ